jgi:hypothetical protein
MLSAFTARPIIELKQQTRAKIETILAHGMSISHAPYSVVVFILFTATLTIRHVLNLILYLQVTASSSALTMAPSESTV